MIYLAYSIAGGWGQSPLPLYGMERDSRMLDAGLTAQALATGLMIGGIYALISAGFTLVFGVLKIINIAHGELLMLGMYGAFFVSTGLGLSPYLSILVVTPALFIFGALLYWGTIRMAINAPELNQLLLTVGLSLFLQNLALVVFSADFRTIESGLSRAKIELGSVIVGMPHLVAFACSIVVTLVLYWLLRSTDMGRSIRAAAENREAALLVGIDVPRVYLVTFAIGAACVGIAGPLLAPIYAITPDVGAMFTLTVFVVVVLGGMGNFLGALAGGLIIGVAESLGGVYMPGSMAPVVSFSVLILVLLFKPEGVFGGKKL